MTEAVGRTVVLGAHIPPGIGPSLGREPGQSSAYRMEAFPLPANQGNEPAAGSSRQSLLSPAVVTSALLTDGVFPAGKQTLNQDDGGNASEGGRHQPERRPQAVAVADDAHQPAEKAAARNARTGQEHEDHGGVQVRQAIGAIDLRRRPEWRHAYTGQEQARI